MISLVAACGLIALANSIHGTPAPIPGTPAPVPGTPAPTAASRRLLAVSGTPAPVPGTPAPVAGTPAPITGTPAPTAASRRLLADELTTVEPSVATSEPTTSKPTPYYLWHHTGMLDLLRSEPFERCWNYKPSDPVVSFPCVDQEAVHDCAMLSTENVRWGAVKYDYCPGQAGKFTITCRTYQPCTDRPIPSPTQAPTPRPTQPPVGVTIEEAQEKHDEACRDGLELPYRFHTRLCRDIKDRSECGRYYYLLRSKDFGTEEPAPYALPCQWMAHREEWRGSKCIASTACMKEITWQPVAAKNSTATHTYFPTAATAEPTRLPTVAPTTSAAPTTLPTALPTSLPTALPSQLPTQLPTAMPSLIPTAIPTAMPTDLPTASPTRSPTAAPTRSPTVGTDRFDAFDAGAFVPRCGKIKIWGGPSAVYEVEDAFACYKKCSVSCAADAKTGDCGGYERWVYIPASGNDSAACRCILADVEVKFKELKGHFGSTLPDAQPSCGSVKVAKTGAAVKLAEKFESPEACRDACARGSAEHAFFEAFNFKKSKCTCINGIRNYKLGQAFGSASSVKN